MAKYVECEAGYDYATLEDWYINSVSETDSPVWTKNHLEELLNDFYLIPKDTDTIEVIKCKDCKYGRDWIVNRKNELIGHCYNKGRGIDVRYPPDVRATSCCSFGIKKG